MQDEGKVFGFTLSMSEAKEANEKIWDVTKKFAKDFPKFISENNFKSFITKRTLKILTTVNSHQILKLVI